MTAADMFKALQEQAAEQQQKAAAATTEQARIHWARKAEQSLAFAAALERAAGINRSAA